MKKFVVMVCVIVCVIGIAGCAWGGVSLSAFPDPAFREHLRNYDSGWVEYDSNGKAISDAYGNTIYFGKDNGILDDKEIEGITYLAFGYYNKVTSLEGIKHLTSLKYLDCSYGQLTKIDVSGMKNLTTLHFYGNPLVEFNASNCTALAYVNVDGYLPPPPVIAPPATNTSLSYNGDDGGSWVILTPTLKKIDASNCTAMQSLSCGSLWGEKPQLSELNINGCTALQYLSCGNTSLSAIDVSIFPALVEVTLMNNPLKTFDISNHTALTKLTCDSNDLTQLNVNGCTALTELYCYDNQLTVLDVSTNTALTTLYCSDNNLTQLNVNGCTALTELYCYDNQLAVLDVSGLASLTLISCQRNPLKELNASGCTALAHVNAYENAHFEWDLYHDINTLEKLNASGCTALTDLDCSYNNLTELDVSGCTALTSLGFSSNDLTELDLSDCTALMRLSCSENKLTSLDLSKNTALTYLNCYSSDLTELDLSKNTALTELHCSENKLTSLDLSKNTALTELHCGENKLTSLDLRNNTALTNLNCEHNELTELDLSKNTALTSAWCYWQGRSGLNVNKTSRGYEVNMKDYVSDISNIDAESLYQLYQYILVSYNSETGIIIFSKPITELRYWYITHSPNNDPMNVTITNPLSIAALERSQSGTVTNTIIRNITDDSYIGLNGHPLTESTLYYYDASDYSKSGLAADGNSRLILRVQTDKPGTVSFSGYDDIGAKLESLSRKELTASDQLSTTEINSDTHQVSAVLVAPERFPEDKNFPSDTFKIHVKFTDEDGEITEDDLELKIEAAPVILIPGMLDTIEPKIEALLPRMFPLYRMRYRYGDAGHTFGSSNNSGIWRKLIDAGFKEKHIALFDYNGATGVKNNVDSLFNALKKMFDTYAQEGIVCTKADVVAHGLGGLLVRQYLDESGKNSSSSSNNNWSEISYKQGMILRVVNIAVPHRGTPLANAMLGDLSVININSGLPKVRDKAAYLMLKYFPASSTEVYLAPRKALRDLSVGSEVTNLSFPAKVPMHFIYGDVKNSLDTLENIKDWLFLIGGIRDIWNTLKKLRGRLNELEKAAAPLEKVHSRAITEDGVLDETTFEGVTKLLNRNNMLRLQEFMKTVLKIAQNGMSFAEKISRSPHFTEFMKHADFIMVALGGASNLITMPVDLFFVIPNLLFSGQPHDFFVPKSSAAAAFPEYSTGFPAIPGLLDILYFRYSEICHQNDVAEFVGYLLKDAPLSKFVMLDESLPLPGSVSAKTSSNGASDSDIDIDFENFYVKNFSLTVRKSTRENFGDGMTALKFIADSSIKISNDVKLVVQKDSSDRIFPMFTENGVNFESLLVFSSSDGGAMTAYCYAPSGKGNLYISDTVNVEVSAALIEDEEENTPPEILTGTLTNAITNQPCNLQLTASGATPLAWTHKGNLPKGLTLDSSGVISGTPTKAGKYTFTVTASNTYGESSKKFTLQVYDPVSITTSSLKAGTIGKSYNVTMKAKGSRIITWSAEGLPNGLTINEKGKISGKPTAHGDFTVKITATNPAGSVTESLQLEIKGIAPKISGTLTKATLNESYSSALKVTGSTPLTLSISGNLPEGLTFDTSTGIISGIPASYERSGYKLTITASNDAGIKSKKVTLMVKGTAPKITTAKLPEATVNQSYSFTLSATGSGPITFTAEDLPEGLTLSGGVISGKPTEAAKSFRITVYAENPVKTVRKSFTLKINDEKDDTKLPVAVSSNENTNAALTDEVFVGSIAGEYVFPLGEISCDVPGMYDFSLELPDYVPEDSELVYIANSESPSDDDDIAEFFDDTGEEISAVPARRKIIISIWLNEGVIYKPFVVVKK